MLPPRSIRRSRRSLGAGLLALVALVVAAPVGAWDGGQDTPPTGITAALSQVQLNGHDEVSAAPGHALTFQVTYDLYNWDNPGAITAIRIGWAGQTGPIGCPYVNNTNVARNGTQTAGSYQFLPTFNAPTARGSYWLQWNAQAQVGCPRNTGTFAPASDPGRYTIAHLWVGPRIVKNTIARASLISIAGGGTDVHASGGETISVKLSLGLAPTCTTCRYQVVVGWAGAAKPAKCIYNGKPGQGIDVDKTFTLVVPTSTPGGAFPTNQLLAWQVRKTTSTSCVKSSWPQGAPALHPSRDFLGHVIVD